MIREIGNLAQRPSLWQKSTAKFWDDPYIAQSMLKAHLDPDLDAATRRHDFVRQSADWIADTLPSDRYKRLIDLGCGPGLYAELFHTKGYQVTGIDLSENSIAYAQKSAQSKGLSISYRQGNYIQSPLSGEYDLATMIYCGFGALPKEERSLLLKKVHSALSDKGCFLFDVFTPFEYENRKEYRSWAFEDGGFWRAGPCLLLQSLYRYDEENTFLRQHIVLSPDEAACYNIWEHTFVPEELREDLNAAGFLKLQFYANTAGTPYQKEGRTICVLAKK